MLAKPRFNPERYQKSCSPDRNRTCIKSLGNFYLSIELRDQILKTCISLVSPEADILSLPDSYRQNYGNQWIDGKK